MSSGPLSKFELHPQTLPVSIQHGENFLLWWSLIPAPVVNHDQRNHLHMVTQHAQWMFQNFDYLYLDTRSSHTYAF